MTSNNQSPATGATSPRPPLSPAPAPLSSPRQSFAEHRQSFSELRGVPSSPRTQRQPSLSHAALQDLLNYPPLSHRGQNAFAGRDWKKVRVGEIVDSAEVRFAELDTSVEDATKVCIPNRRSIQPQAIHD